MSGLTDALKQWDSLDMDELMEPEATIVDAARKWADHQCLPDEADGSVNYPSLDPPEETDA